MNNLKKITVVGGAGHVGLPLSIALADAAPQLQITIYDVNAEAVDMVNAGEMPFLETGAPEKLSKVIGKNLKATIDPVSITSAEVLIVVIGTPIDEFLNPTFRPIAGFIEKSLPYLRDDQILILRSTVYPGTSERIHRILSESGKRIHVAFCPERIAEGKAMEELYTLPHIISGFDEIALSASREIFGHLTSDIIELEPLEAELAKLFINSWRYIHFAIANQFFTLAMNSNADFYRIYEAITHNYPRAAGFPVAGFTAGPCLFKDTMMLSSFARNQFFLGHSAMMINEGLPQLVLDKLREVIDLGGKTVGILGMAFKGESDDIRSSLSFKLKKILEFYAKKVMCSDEYVNDPHFVPLEEVLKDADILIIAAPHARYRSIRTEKPMVDIWNCTPNSGNDPLRKI